MIPLNVNVRVKPKTVTVPVQSKRFLKKSMIEAKNITVSPLSYHCVHGKDHRH